MICKFSIIGKFNQPIFLVFSDRAGTEDLMLLVG